MGINYDAFKKFLHNQGSTTNTNTNHLNNLNGDKTSIDCIEIEDDDDEFNHGGYHC